MDTKHLDIGCGKKPRNPYRMSAVYGCDIRDLDNADSENHYEYRQANLVLAEIPFGDNCFDTVSAYDFIEHVPRQLMDQRGQLRNPFVDLMSEIHRVLKPGGEFLA
ncbi:MAG: class I SAM-dependent methyltransferase, partial [Gallionellaceae bacterium]|nr:class I SAM-dependent methyltransferase [Gallionellaceae bacterium]